MEAVNIHIGPLVFDQADYDHDGDVLYLHRGRRGPPRARRRLRAMSCASRRALTRSSD